MKLKLIFFFLISYLHTSSFAQEEAIEWLTFDDLAENYQKERKPLLIFFHTEWCKYCKMQKNTTFKDSSIINKLNTNFYCLNFDAESKDTVSFFERKYSFNTENRYHDLAIYLGSSKGVLNFPATIILDNKLQLRFKKSGVVSKNELLKIMAAIDY